MFVSHVYARDSLLKSFRDELLETIRAGVDDAPGDRTRDLLLDELPGLHRPSPLVEPGKATSALP